MLQLIISICLSYMHKLHSCHFLKSVWYFRYQLNNTVGSACTFILVCCTNSDAFEPYWEAKNYDFFKSFFVSVLVTSNFCLQAFIKYCTIEVTEINERFMTSHNANIADLHCATLLSVTHVRDILFNTSLF